MMFVLTSKKSQPSQKKVQYILSSLLFLLSSNLSSSILYVFGKSSILSYVARNLNFFSHINRMVLYTLKSLRISTYD